MSALVQGTDLLRTPTTVVTGFLGSGKTTLLRVLLGHPELSDAAVIINEFGDVGLDHRLVRAITNEIVVLPSGCLCCAVRDDLVDTLGELAQRRASREVPPFRRVIIETSGLADPTAVAATLLTNHIVAPLYRMHLIVATLDAVFGEAQLKKHSEAVDQVALADRLVLTKGDLVPPEKLAGLEETARRLNPAARIVRPRHTMETDPASVLDGAVMAERPPSVPNGERHTRPDDGRHHHTEDVTALSFSIADPVEWDDYMAWIDRFMAAHGRELLRLKGVLRVAGKPHPLAVHGIHHLLFPPEELAENRPDDETSTLVLIMRGVAPDPVAEDLAAALGAKLHRAR